MIILGKLHKSGNRHVVSEPTGSEETDYLSTLERVQFSNGKLALDLAGNAGTAAKLIGTLLSKAALQIKTLTGLVINLLDQNYSPETIVNLGLASPTYLAKAGSGGHVDFVKLVYQNVAGITPTPEAMAPYVSQLNHGATQASLALMAAETPLLAAQIDLVGLVQHGLPYL